MSVDEIPELQYELREKHAMQSALINLNRRPGQFNRTRADKPQGEMSSIRNVKIFRLFQGISLKITEATSNLISKINPRIEE